MLRNFGILICCVLLASCFVPAQTGQVARSTASDPLQPLDFLIGTWTAKTNGAGSAGASALGTYTFRRDLNGHALERSSSTDSCSAPSGFDCQHHDQLTIFPDPHSAHGAGLYALYLDSEGHVIYYTVTTPDPRTALFESQGPAATPHFRLRYHLQGSGPDAVMTGSFEGAATASQDFHPYLQWTGRRQ